MWTSSNPAIASVQGWIGATVTGNAVGWATVTAWVDGVFAQATVFVVAPDSAAARRQPTIDQEVIRRGPLRQRS